MALTGSIAALLAATLQSRKSWNEPKVVEHHIFLEIYTLYAGATGT